MPITNVKLSPPVYNSDRDVPPYNEWYNKYIQFVLYNDGGDALVALINRALGREDTTYATYTVSTIPAALRLEDDEIEQILALEADGAVREIDTYTDLTPVERALDKDLYAILTQCVTGQHRVLLDRVQIPSFVQAWCMLAHELSAKKRSPALLVMTLSPLMARGTSVLRWRTQTVILSYSKLVMYTKSISPLIFFPWAS